MSETFLIKKTAFSDSGLISDRETNSFVIGPGELNGPGGVARNTDLKLYGFGSQKWGEGVNQNILRILENFACPGKLLGDFKPGTDDPSTYIPGHGSPLIPGNGSYDPGSDVVLPKDEYDLGIGNGITVPFPGQNWFNTFNEIMYTYTVAAGWSSAGEDAVFVGDVNMSSNTIFNLANIGSPEDPSAAINLGSADVRYINTIGDTMSGILDMGSYKIENLADPTLTTDALNLGFGDGRYMQFDGGTLTGDIQFVIDGSPNLVESAGIRWTGNSDSARIYVEGYAGTESSRLVFYMGDDGSSQDYISFMSNNGGTVTETLKIDSTQVESLVPFHANNMTAGTFTASNIVASSSFTVDGDINFSDNVQSRLNAPTISNTYIEFNTAGSIRDIEFVSNNNLGFAQRANTVSGVYRLDAHAELDMNSNRISNLLDPSFAQDAATRAYVDANAITGGASYAQNGYIFFDVAGQTLLIQWGHTYVVGSGSTTFNFPIAFSATYSFSSSIYATFRPPGGQYDAHGGSFVSNTQGLVWTAQNSAHYMDWIAIGTIV